ncbi:MAG: hypothetical protein KGH67_05455, partial [Candidatus Micrarchaeota archaeon]|nr:hypothetical protein [Candidatus Micrarchaeota archaeon]
FSGWSSTTSYPVTVYDHSCSAYNGYLYCVGGWTSSSTGGTAKTYYVPIGSSGLGSWSPGKTYPTTIYAESCQASNAYLYCVAGFNDTTSESTDYYATVGSGISGSWTTTTNYPNSIFSSSCATYNGYIYCVGGNSFSGLTSAVYYAPIGSYGIGTWTGTTSYPYSITSSSCSIYNGYIYCVGGNIVNSATNKVYYARVSSSGVDTWQQTTSYPTTSIAGESCQTASGFIYCVGGVTMQGSTSAVYYAPVSSSGVGTWTSVSPYPTTVYGESCSIYNGYIYCVGGNYGNSFIDNGSIGDIISNVYYANLGVGSSSSTTSSATTSTTTATTTTISTTTSMTTSTTTLTTTIPPTTTISGTLSVPSGILYYVPITLTNGQSSALPPGSQVRENVNPSTYKSYETANLQNIEFFYANGTIIPSWLESGNSNSSSSAVYWLKIAPGIGPNGNFVVYMGFASTSANLFNKVNTGEAPQLSGTYAQYDDGSNVFSTLYQNFAGTSTPSGWVSSGSGITQNNGLSTGSSFGYVVTSSTYGPNANYTVEVYAKATSPNVNNSDTDAGYVLKSTSISDTAVGWILDGPNIANKVYDFTVNNGWQSETDGSLTPSSGAYHVMSTYWSSTSSATFSYDYGSTDLITTHITSNPLSVGLLTLGTPSVSYVQWVRIRSYPPNGVMPSSTFGGVVSIGGGTTSTTTSTSTTTTMLPTTTTQSQCGNTYCNWTNGPSTSSSYFPIGVWDTSPGDASEYEKIGINLFVGDYGSMWSASDYSSNNTQVILPAGSSSAPFNHAITGWDLPDEPDVSCTPASTVLGWYSTNKSRDPTRPIMVNFGQGASLLGYAINTSGDGCVASASYFKQASSGADIVSSDLYPVADGHPNDLQGIAQEVDNLKSWQPNKTIWTFIEAADNVETNGVSMTASQIKSEAWMALIHGSQGIIYFDHDNCYSGGGCHEQGIFAGGFSSAIGAIDANITALASVLNSQTVANGTQVSTSPSTTVDTMVKDYNGNVYLFAIESLDKATTATFTVNGLTTGTATVIGENRQIQISGGKFSDSFAGYGVHIYNITPSGQTSTTAYTSSPTSSPTTSALTTAPTTTSGGIGGPTGGGGPQKPTVVKIPGGYEITNFTQYQFVDLNTTNGGKIRVTENYITPTSAGVSVNNASIALSPGTTVYIGNFSGSNYYSKLVNISYLPIEDTMKIDILTNTTATNVSTSQIVYTYTISGSAGVFNSNISRLSILDFDITSLKLNLIVSTGNNASAPLSLQFNTPSNIKPLDNHNNLLVMNTSIISNDSLNVSALFDYPCTEKGVRAYILSNSTWKPINTYTNNPTSCTLSFKLPFDPIVGIFANQTITTTASVPTTMPPTTTIQQGSNQTTYAVYVLMVVVIIIIAAVAYLYIRKRGSGPSGVPASGNAIDANGSSSAVSNHGTLPS